MRGNWGCGWVLRDNWRFGWIMRGCGGIMWGIWGCGGAYLLWFSCRYFVGPKISVITQVTLTTQFFTVRVMGKQT